jgi:hypothetical protein
METPSPSASLESAWHPPEIPGKYDIIPIHSSDRAAFKRCRRYWDWSSPARHNLRLRADVHGVNIPLAFGTFVHYALEKYYTPGLRRDPVEAFQYIFDIAWRGGTVTRDEVELSYDLAPKLTRMADRDSDPVMQAIIDIEAPTLYSVRGLEDIIPSPDHEEWDELRHLGVEMMTYYKQYAEINDDFTVLVAEHQFSVPIWDYENNRILRAVDIREQSPNYGKSLEVHARGRMDEIYAKPNGRLGILENKTAQRWGEEELRKLETDEQCTNYLYCAEIEAKYYDLPNAGEPMEEITYNVLRKAYPKPPTQLKNGRFSTDRQNESTTYELLTAFINYHLPPNVFPLTERESNYVSYIRDVGDEQFIVRKNVLRNRHQLENNGKRLYMEAMDMLNPEVRIYPNISNSYQCLNCQFRGPCIAKEDGGDWKFLIEENYARNVGR